MQAQLATTPQQRLIFLAYVAPFAVLTLLFGLWPILLSLKVSLTASASALKPDAVFVGLANYRAVFADPLFLQSLKATLIYTAMAVVLNVGFALGYALLLNSPLIGKGKTLFKIAIFLPVVTPDLAGYVVWRFLYDRSFGAINALATALDLPLFGGLSSPNTVTLALLIAELWRHAGFYVIIFLANLALCDKALVEAASLDGANRWQIFRHVLIPQLRPAILINGIYALIQFLKTFTVIVVMTKGGPADLTNFVSYYAYQLFDQGRYGEATAMGSVLFACVVAAALAAYALGNRRPQQ
jgi:multiple sugar transport system permease protein